MAANDSPKQSNDGIALAAVVVLALGILSGLYVASSGPGVWLIDNGYFSPDSTAVAVFYWPLNQLAYLSPGTGEGLRWYVNLFHGPVPSRDVPALDMY